MKVQVPITPVFGAVRSVPVHAKELMRSSVFGPCVIRDAKSEVTPPKAAMSEIEYHLDSYCLQFDFQACSHHYVRVEKWGRWRWHKDQKPGRWTKE
jgi:hypothetical protein